MNTPLGRAEEARWIEARLAEPAGPIIGLIGPPGIGKSTLLKHACAAHQRAGHPVITLAGEPDAASLWARLALAAQLPARDEAGALRGLASAPASLIAIDAAEAGLTVCADVLARVRAAAPQHVLLYASRERAPLDAALLLVRPLPRDASRALFAARAARLCGDWTPDDPAALDALLELLGDHPLALSLVAARCAVLSASQLLALVRADLLGAAASPEGTSVGLEEALGAAWRGLGEPQRDALGVIACFQGQLPLEEVWSALERCGCAPSRLGAVDLSQRLVAASWLERAEVAGVPQLWLHVTTRAFIRAKLGHDAERHARLRSAWLDAVSERAAALGIAPPYEHRALAALREIDAALADLEAAFEAALPSRPADACQLLLARSASLAALGQLARALLTLDDARAP